VNTHADRSECFYLVTRSLEPAGRGKTRWRERASRGGSSPWGDLTHNPTLVHRTELQLP
jgi:hypothetical protein